MIFLKNGYYIFEFGIEPCLRSCWECNPAHKHLRESPYLHLCYRCGKVWCLSWDFDTEATHEEFNQHFEFRGVQYGESTLTSTRREEIHGIN